MRGGYASADAAFILAFAIIILNTDLHKAGDDGGSKKHKPMSRDQFVNNLRGVNALSPERSVADAIRVLLFFLTCPPALWAMMPRLQRDSR